MHGEQRFHCFISGPDFNAPHYFLRVGYRWRAGGCCKTDTGRSSRPGGKCGSKQLQRGGQGHLWVICHFREPDSPEQQPERLFQQYAHRRGRYGGCAASILLDVDGVRIYHAGDTCLTGEMKTIRELYAPQIALLPIGGTYTMDVEHAAMAAKWLGVRTVIPMHYGTFPEIQADLERFRNLIAFGNTACQILNPSEIK